MKHIPNKIFLNIGYEPEKGDDFNDFGFDWWISGKSYKQFYAETVLQQSLNFKQQNYEILNIKNKVFIQA